MLNTLRGAAIALAVLTQSAAAEAIPTPNWAAFAVPGTHAIMRHALAPGTGDPEGFKLGDCSTQRNLNEAGRRQAVLIGEAITRAGIAVSRVLTSQWCRATETARLLNVGPVTEESALNSFFQDGGQRDQQTARLRQILGTAPASEKMLLVTHQVNMTALTGVVPDSGEVLVISIGKDGVVRVVDRIATDPP